MTVFEIATATLALRQILTSTSHSLSFCARLFLLSCALPAGRFPTSPPPVLLPFDVCESITALSARGNSHQPRGPRSVRADVSRRGTHGALHRNRNRIGSAALMGGGNSAVSAATVAQQEGLIAGAKATAIAAPSVWLAHRLWPAFRNGLGVSGKTALAISPGFLFFYLVAEHKLNELKRKAAPPRTT